MPRVKDNHKSGIKLKLENMSTIEDVANLDVALPSCQAEKNEKRKTNYKQVLSIQSDFKNRDLPDNYRSVQENNYRFGIFES